jgi:hypothetical protein
MLGRTRSAVRARLDATPLPTELRAFIASLVARTKLRRAEQLDIAAELASHFSEGLASGKSAETLVASYGDARQSAHDLRAGAIAKRHPLDRAAGVLVKWSALGVTAAIAVYLASATAIYLREPVISFDAQAALTARLPRPGPEGRALDLYIAALGDDEGRYRDKWLGDHLVTIEAALEQIDANPAVRDPALEQTVRRSLQELEGVIDTLRTIRTRPVFGMALGADALRDDAAVRFFGARTLVSNGSPPAANASQPAAFILLPQQSVVRYAARLLCHDARMAAIDGRTDDFMESVEAAIACGSHAGEPAFLISVLIEMGIYQKVNDTVKSAVEQSPGAFTEPQLARLEELVRGLPCDLVAGVEAEHLMIRDVIQRSFSDDGGGDGVLLPRSWGRVLADFQVQGTRPTTFAALDFLAGPFAATALPSRREVEEWAAKRIAASIGAISATTSDEFEAHKRDLDAMQGDGQSQLFSVTAVMLPSVDRLIEKPQRMRGALNDTADLIARERAKRAAESKADTIRSVI